MSKEDEVIVQDGSGRRRFLRTSSAFALAGAATVASTGVRADDCDRNATSAEAKQATAGSDSDTGGAADAAGCGRKPSISKAPAPDHSPVKVKKVLG
jgi:hypothetical protein